MISIAQIQQAVADSYHVRVEQLVAKGRAKDVAWPRHIAMYLSRELCGVTQKTIGEAFGGRTHDTAKYGINRVKQHISVHGRDRATIEQIAKGITAPFPDPELRGAIPVVLYFKDAKHADEFIALFKSVKPNCVAKRL